MFVSVQLLHVDFFCFIVLNFVLTVLLVHLNIVSLNSLQVQRSNNAPFIHHPFPVWLRLVQLRWLLTHLVPPLCRVGCSHAEDPPHKLHELILYHAMHLFRSFLFKWNKITAWYCTINADIIVQLRQTVSTVITFHFLLTLISDLKFHISLGTRRLMLLCPVRISHSKRRSALLVPASSWTLPAALASLLQLPRPSLDSWWLERSQSAIENPRVLQPLVFTLKIRRPF